MAIYHIDIVNGNDANTGLSWAQAWKTFTNGATAARIAPGDDIKVAKTADPTSIGTATWTDGKIGNSITFASAPTKSIDTAKAGWVTMGTGSTVTNGQSTAYMTTTTFGGTTVGALQWTTSASANGCYKDLGSTIDYSGYQQICFWFRTTSAFDCTGSQNLLVDLCSDASATTVVSALTAPKWNYASGMWYPIVIDAGSALSSTVRSIRFRTTNTTSQTFYVDEIFASPAGGLTLWSLIGLNNGTWYPIRSIRDADVQLLAAFNATLATGALVGVSGAIDASWMGTTTTATTWKLEPSRALVPTTGPTGAIGVNNTESASQALPRRVSGGWNTSTDTIDGETWLDGITFNNTTAFNSTSNPFIVYENFGVVRFQTGMTSTNTQLYRNCGFVACGTVSYNLTSTIDNTFLANANIDTITFKSCTGCNSIPRITIAGAVRIKEIVYDEIWGAADNIVASVTNGVAITMGNVYVVPTSSATTAFSTSNSVTVKCASLRQCNSASISSAAGIVPVQFSGNNSTVTIDTVNILRQTASGLQQGANNILSVNNYTVNGSTGVAVVGSTEIGDNNIFNIGAATLGGGMIVCNFSSMSTGTSPTGRKIYFHNWNGAAGDFRVFINDVATSPAYFELQAVDVYTPGSKAVRFTNGSYSNTSAVFNKRIDLKLASAAAEANKLVTVTARVKRNSTACTAGIYIPGLSGFLPGYTTDQVANCTSTGTFELLTITFTPTQNCVFDVFAQCTPTGTVSPNIVWDTLTISQAA